jgi:hypothetical protein
VSDFLTVRRLWDSITQQHHRANYQSMSEYPLQAKLALTRLLRLIEATGAAAVSAGPPGLLEDPSAIDTHMPEAAGHASAYVISSTFTSQ